MSFVVIDTPPDLPPPTINTLADYELYYQHTRRGRPLSEQTDELLRSIYKHFDTLNNRVQDFAKSPLYIKVSIEDNEWSNNRPSYFQNAYSWIARNTDFTLRSRSRFIDQEQETFMELRIWFAPSAQKHARCVSQ